MKHKPLPIIPLAAVILIMWGAMIIIDYFSQHSAFIETSSALQICFLACIAFVLAKLSKRKKIPVNNGKTIALFIENRQERPITITLFTDGKTFFSPENDLHYSCIVPNIKWKDAVSYLRTGVPLKSIRVSSLTRCPINLFSVSVIQNSLVKSIDRERTIEYDQQLRIVDNIDENTQFRFKLWARQQVLFVFELQQEIPDKILLHSRED